ncbi:hypothetical protein ACP4OV_003050 [Aristida adscensionis]
MFLILIKADSKTFTGRMAVVLPQSCSGGSMVTSSLWFYFSQVSVANESNPDGHWNSSFLPFRLLDSFQNVWLSNGIRSQSSLSSLQQGPEFSSTAKQRVQSFLQKISC